MSELCATTLASSTRPLQASRRRSPTGSVPRGGGRRCARHTGADRGFGQGRTAHSALPTGPVHEGALFVLFEIMVDRPGERLGVGPDAMRARHSSLE